MYIYIYIYIHMLYLQVARRLAGEGWEVAVLERQPGLGGVWA